MTHRRTIATAVGEAWADIDWPEITATQAKPRGLLMIGHGAGGTVEAPDILVVRAACRSAGLVVAAVTQPYRVAGRKAPVPASALDTAWGAVLDELRADPALATLPLLVAGRSSGARVACRTAAATGARGVIALAFPLHPPGRPERLRQAELDAAGVPVLVFQGASDPFGMPMPSSTRGRRRVVVVLPGDHSLRREHPQIAAHTRRFALARTH